MVIGGTREVSAGSLETTSDIARTINRGTRVAKSRGSEVSKEGNGQAVEKAIGYPR